MGEHADDQLNGAFCNHCGVYLDVPEVGYPRWCWDDREEANHPGNVVRETTVVHLQRDEYDVRIDRRSKWGNPFTIRKGRPREEVIADYREWIASQPDLLAALPELEGKRLGCWCAPKPCHGDVLVQLVRSVVAARNAELKRLSEIKSDGQVSKEAGGD